MTDRPRVRRARETDIPALAPLVFLPAERMYERIAPDRRRALRIIEADLRRGTVRHAWAAELDGAVAGVIVAYPYREDPVRVRRLLRVALPRTPPWHWLRVARVFTRGHRQELRHQPDSLYVDGLGIAPRFRRRGVGLALLRHAASAAAGNGLPAVTLETAETNRAAVALYEKAGFEVANVVPARPPVPAILGFRRPAGD